MARADHRFKFVILGRYPARMRGNQTAVTVNMLAGEEGRLVHCGTLTLAESEFETFYSALKESLQDAADLEDHSQARPPA
jgi:hypothetical protein